MKRLMALLVSIGFALGTMGCGSTPAKTAEKTEAAAEKPAKKALKKAKGNRMEIAEEDE